MGRPLFNLKLSEWIKQQGIKKMSYEVVTKINGVVKTRKKFGGSIPKPTITECKPTKMHDREYYYFVIEGNPIINRV